MLLLGSFRRFNSESLVRKSSLQAGIRGRRCVHVEAKLVQMGITLPHVPSKPKANYVSWVKIGNLIYISGHLPQKLDGSLISGRLGENMNLSEGQEAARLVGIQLLATMKSAVGDLDKIKRIVKLFGIVNSTNDFHSQHLVVNGCSDLMGDVFGLDVGQHARSAIGTSVLPLGVPVEIEAIIEV